MTRCPDNQGKYGSLIRCDGVMSLHSTMANTSGLQQKALHRLFRCEYALKPLLAQSSSNKISYEDDIELDNDEDDINIALDKSGIG